MSDMIVLAMGWPAAIDREVTRLQMMSLGFNNEHPMVREFRPLLVSVTNENEKEFMKRFRQTSDVDNLAYPLRFPHNAAAWKKLGVLIVRQLILLPLRFLGFRRPVKTVQWDSLLNSSKTMTDFEFMTICNENVNFVVLGRRENQFDAKAGGEMR